MAVSHSPAGFTGTVDEIGEVRRFGLAGPPFRVGSVNEWAPSADSVVNRRVNISIGQAAVCGVADVINTPDSVTFAANNGTTNRFDAVVATWAWAANASAGLTAHTVTFRVIPGTTAPPQVNPSITTVDNAKINRVRGVQYDALLAVVRVRPSVGLLTSGDVVDCRMWAGYEGYANAGSAQYLSLLDTQPGSLVHAVDTDIVWNRLAGAWGFEKWIGSDKTKQPMMSMRYPTAAILHNVPTQIGGWPNFTDHSQGLLTLSGSSTVICNVYGRVRVVAHAYSDSTHFGGSLFQMAYPAGGGDYLSTLSDERQRGPGGYGGSGSLRQTISPGPLLVAPGDALNLNIFQLNADSVPVTYDFYLSVTYV